MVIHLTLHYPPEQRQRKHNLYTCRKFKHLYYSFVLQMIHFEEEV